MRDVKDGVVDIEDIWRASEYLDMIGDIEENEYNRIDEQSNSGRR